MLRSIGGRGVKKTTGEKRGEETSGDARATGERQPGLVVVKTKRGAQNAPLAQRVCGYGLEARVIRLEPF